MDSTHLLKAKNSVLHFLLRSLQLFYGWVLIVWANSFFLWGPDNAQPTVEEVVWRDRGSKKMSKDAWFLSTRVCDLPGEGFSVTARLLLSHEEILFEREKFFWLWINLQADLDSNGQKGISPFPGIFSLHNVRSLSLSSHASHKRKGIGVWRWKRGRVWEDSHILFLL